MSACFGCVVNCTIIMTSNMKAFWQNRLQIIYHRNLITCVSPKKDFLLKLNLISLFP